MQRFANLQRDAFAPRKHDRRRPILCDNSFGKRRSPLPGQNGQVVAVFSRSLQEAISVSSRFHLLLPYRSSWHFLGNHKHVSTLLQAMAFSSLGCELSTLILHNLASHTDIAANGLRPPDAWRLRYRVTKWKFCSKHMDVF